MSLVSGFGYVKEVRHFLGLLISGDGRTDRGKIHKEDETENQKPVPETQSNPKAFQNKA
jgi:hypothetical protein